VTWAPATSSASTSAVSKNAEAPRNVFIVRSPSAVMMIRHRPVGGPSVAGLTR
jgi:hypothetical protein